MNIFCRTRFYIVQSEFIWQNEMLSVLTGTPFEPLDFQYFHLCELDNTRRTTFGSFAASVSDPDPGG